MPRYIIRVSDEATPLTQPAWSDVVVGFVQALDAEDIPVNLGPRTWTLSDPTGPTHIVHLTMDLDQSQFARVSEVMWRIERQCEMSLFEWSELEYRPVYPPEPIRWFGLDCPVSQLADLSEYTPNIRYMRDFGANNSYGKLQLSGPLQPRPVWAAQNNTMLHYSHKEATSPDSMSSWAKSQTRPYMYTFWHEPMGDVAPDVYRQTSARLVRAIQDNDPNQHMRYNGPILTRYWMDEGKGNPSEWMYEGANAFFADAYLASWGTAQTEYPSPEWMFGSTARFARSLGLPWGIPEWGGERLPYDLDGSGRAEWIRNCGDWLLNQPDCIAVAWWQRGGTYIAVGSPESLALSALLEKASGG